MQLWLHYWRKAVPKPRLFCGNGEQPKFAVLSHPAPTSGNF
ncbi:hypothetical protein [Rubritalea tangerina]